MTELNRDNLKTKGHFTMSGNNRIAAEKLMRMLVVDDDPDMLQLLWNTIAADLGEGVRVVSASSPTEARAELGTDTFDVLVTDLEMPGMSGLDLLRYAKHRNPWTQVIVVTGHSTQGAILDAMELGASDYLLKPLDPDELVRSIREAAVRFRRWRKALAGTWATV